MKLITKINRPIKNKKPLETGDGKKTSQKINL